MTDLSTISDDDLIAELTARRARIDHALESARQWETRHGKLVAQAAAAFGLSAGSLFTKTRKINIVDARTTAFALLRADGASNADIAGIFGMDVSSVPHALRRHQNLLEADPRYRRRWESIGADAPSPSPLFP